jgi:hypothetical protein
MHVPIFESPKSGDRFGRKNRRAGIELFCFNFYSPLHLTVKYIRCAVHLRFNIRLNQVLSGIYHIITERWKAGACRMYVVRPRCGQTITLHYMPSARLLYPHERVGPCPLDKLYPCSHTIINYLKNVPLVSYYYNAMWSNGSVYMKRV